MESVGESIWIGLVAGFIATVILSGMMLMKNAMGFMPQFDMISMMAGLMNSSHAMAWAVHFVVGTRSMVASSGGGHRSSAATSTG